MPKITLKHDYTFDIALGRYRNESSWKNKEIQWSDFVNRVSTTKRTHETYKEYIAAKKNRQDEIKDVGGYVGGYVAKGRRTKNNITFRQLITLDIDFAPASIWDDFTFLYGNAGVIYSTHKHSPDKPRYRLIIPLDRTVLADEYQPIARRIAANLGIDFFDHTTFQPSRLMYWPSTSVDGEYEFNYQDGSWLSADDVLNTYRDWRDSSEWPMCEAESDIVHNGIKKQGDPLEKTGMVGAYCRTHSITDVIEGVLADVYDPCDVDGRYTYKEGSTAGGLVVYEDKFAFSHHGTDPTSGKLCNAFDLVRIHKFGAKDEDVREGTPPNRLPSYNAMLDYCTQDKQVRMQLGVERLAEAKADFDIEVPETDIYAPENDEWLAELDIDVNKNYRSTVNNVLLILNNDPALKGKLAFNSFEQREIATKNLPWRKVTPATTYLTDRDDAGVRHYMEKVYGISGMQKTTDAMALHLAANSFHPVREYLEKLEWDGTPRIDTLLIDYLGVEDSPYTRAIMRKCLTAGVARIYSPGIKFDYMLLLLGPQGAGKSTLISKLGQQWFSDSFTTVQGKEAYEQLQGVWLVEVAELAGLKKADVETVKHFISKQWDRYRVSYGRRLENFPRQCIFIGSANVHKPLKDITGNRRFWPAIINAHEPEYSVFDDLTPAVVNQIWAEAVESYTSGHTLYLTAEMEEVAKQVQAEHTETDDRMGQIQEYLHTLLPGNWDSMDFYERRGWLASDELTTPGYIDRVKVCAAEIWCELLGGTPKDMEPYRIKAVHDIMQNMPGWEATGKSRFPIYGLQRTYRRTAEGLNKKLLEDVKRHKGSDFSDN